MTSDLRRDGMYARLDGVEYSANRDTRGNLVVTTADRRALALGFEDRYGVGTFTRTVAPSELEELYTISHEGTYRGSPVTISVNARGGILVGTSRADLAETLTLPRVDKGWWEREVDADDPDLSITEVQTPHPVGAAHDTSTDPDRYFVQYGPDRTPNGLLRRHYTAAGFEDQVLRDVGQWAPDRHGSVQQAVVNALESPLEEITLDRAREFERMVAERAYRPFST